MNENRGVLMLLSKPYKPDPRVAMELDLLKKVSSFTVIAWDRECKYKKREAIFNRETRVEIIRVRVRAKTRAFLNFVLKLPLYWIKAISIAARHHYKVVHCHDLDTLPLGLFLKLIKRKKVTVVYDAHEIYSEMVRTVVPKLIYKILRLIEILLISETDYVIIPCIERATFYPVGKQKIMVLPNYTLNRINIDELIKRSYRKYEKFTVFYVGGLLEAKGIIDVVRAIMRIPGVKLAIAGSGPLEPFIKTVSKLSDKIEYLRYLPLEEVLINMARSHLTFIMYKPDNYNSILTASNKFFESIAMGTPVLTNKETTLGKTVERYKCGLSVEYGNVGQIAGAILKLKGNKELLVELSENAKSLWKRESLRVKRIQKAFIRKYKRLLECP